MPRIDLQTWAPGRRTDRFRLAGRLALGTLGHGLKRDPRETSLLADRGQVSSGLVLRTGKRIAFAAVADENIDVYTVDVESTQWRRLTSSPGEDRDPSWSPDGTRLAFSSTRDGNAENLCDAKPTAVMCGV